MAALVEDQGSVLSNHVVALAPVPGDMMSAPDLCRHHAHRWRQNTYIYKIKSEKRKRKEEKEKGKEGVKPTTLMSSNLSSPKLYGDGNLMVDLKTWKNTPVAVV